ncbi:hypothetical protein SCMU_21700 [Sinomonas cyclohexanicum]|uniref:MGS-like domain-containing protein n=1 Tax=Sinomonas cyclohexanicum TaxID=322009 RepID=A0ABM7PVM9_SINCY|nr:hypothetical protein SCMU_21700 [Corynebacterium cyclohexanicum]
MVRKVTDSSVAAGAAAGTPVADGEGTIVDLINDGKVDMVFNTPSGGTARGDGYEIRAAATSNGKPCITTVAEFNFAVLAIEAMRSFEWSVTSLQEHEAAVRETPQGTAAEPARA